MGILLPGQELIIPKVHKVKSDETLYSISSRYKLNIDDLIQLNSLKSGAIYPGQILVLEDLKINNKKVKTPITKIQNILPRLPVKGSFSRKKGIINGLLISSSPGESIVSRSAGLVVWTDVNSLLGSLLIVAENDTTLYIYGGNAIFSVAVGDKIKQGGAIGYMEKKNKNPELLYSVYQDGNFREKQSERE